MARVRGTWTRRTARLWGWLWLVAIFVVGGSLAFAQPMPVEEGPDGRLVYRADEHGNRIPDFSHCGYAGGDQLVPTVPARVTVAPAEGDDGPRIQAALDHVAGLPVGDDGFRGAVLLAPGTFKVAGQLRITESGIVLRGSGAGEGGTTILATGTDRRALVVIDGANDRNFNESKAYQVTDEYIPVGANTITLGSAEGLHVGDEIQLVRPSTAEWIETLGMRAFGVGWRPGSRDIRWDRVITAIDGDTVTLDAPITTAIDKRFGGATAEAYGWPGRIENAGIEDLQLVSAYADGNSPGATGFASAFTDDVAALAEPVAPDDSLVGGTSPTFSSTEKTTPKWAEDHAWFGVTIQNAKNAWVRRVEFRHFAGGAVALWENTKWVTVEDCISLAPISEIGGYRRHTFFTQGQLTLFLRCWSEEGRHDFATGFVAAGPNAFVNCYAARALDDSGPLESWASGVLYDNVRVDGADLVLENRWVTPPATGWAAANCVLWQCRAANVRCFRPPTANNWALGCWAQFAGDGAVLAPGDFVDPQSLYQAQLRERVGTAAAARVEPILGLPVGATNPSLAEAADFVSQSYRPARQLIDVIRHNMGAASTDAKAPGGSSATRPQPPETTPHSTTKPLKLQNGWLVIDGSLKSGREISQYFWRGNTRPMEAPSFGPAITRFVPGRVGLGYTDDLAQLADWMQSHDVAAFDHHYGLWYDRRRDDHLMVRRADGDVAAPFYEQPFARSGQGTAWDGLSKYDLTKFNPWYWDRLGEFARLADERGLVLVHQNYFQHNILEAGAHWADSPWRPANNVNDTGLPEPPPYIGDKRVFMAPTYYDMSDPQRRALHRGYIRQCLDNFADRSNVIQMTSAEYSGPLEFTQFWLDTIIEWEKEKGRDVIVALSAPKDVQDAILEDPNRGPHVDVIDIRYWAYTRDGGLYAPKGGQNLAPRQHLRQARQRGGGPAAVVKAVSEYRERYPDKAVLYHAAENCPSASDGWAVLVGGGSLPNVKLPDKLAREVPHLRPTDGIVTGAGQWCLAAPGHDYLIYAERTDQPMTIQFPSELASYRANWIDAKTGAVTAGEEATAGRPLQLSPKTNVLWLERTSVD